MASVRDIRRRIKGVKSTGKITRAMEMISAVKMRKASGAVSAIRPYAKSVIGILHQLTALEGVEPIPFLIERPVKKALYVIVSSHRGLCGGFNTQIAKKLRKTMEEDIDRLASFITIGRKGDALVRRRGGDILASFPDVLAAPSIEGVRPIVRVMVDEFLSGRTDRVVLVYTDFVSVLSQEVKVRALLPVIEKDVHKALNEMGHGDVSKNEVAIEYAIEPDPKTVLEQMIIRLLETEIYHAILESNASQEAARMMAMRNATDAAKDMVDGLTLAFNQLRQSKITQEIAELSAGKAALEN